MRITFLVLAVATLAFGQTPIDPQAVEQIVKQYILQHPEVLLESVRNYQERQQAAELQQSSEAVAAHRDELYRDAATPTSAANEAAVTIVEFFDYRCGYCKRVQNTVETIAAAPDVRIIYKELPILGPESILAAKAALAAQKQGSYRKFHDVLMGWPGAITLESIENLSNSIGMDFERLKTDMQSPQINSLLSRNDELASSLGVQSTPTFIIGGELVSGALSLDAFQSLIDKARRRAKHTN
jgi:protein-disulfide isomerase